MPPDTKYAKSGQVNIAYQVLGNGPPDIVVVSGWVSNIESSWDEPTIARMYERLAGFARVILFDKRGTGLSDRVTDMPNLELRMDDVRAVMDAVGSESAILFGTSEGGAMCALFAATYPNRTAALILHATFPRLKWASDFPWGRTDETLAKLLAYIERAWGTAIGIEQRAPSLANDERFRNSWSRMLRTSASPAGAMALARMNADIDLRSVLPVIRVPTLILHSVNDQVFDIGMARYMAEQIPNAKLIELTGRDHVPMGDDSERILDEVQEFATGTRQAIEHDRILATVLFTDVVNSTEMAAIAGDRRWADLISEHHSLVRTELRRFNGREVDTAGDGFFATFDGPARAVRCACSISDKVRLLGLEIRAGLHTGECEVVSDKLIGISVHIGARIAGLASAGEVLVSRTVKDLVAGSALSFDDRGVHALKGVPGDWTLYAVIH